jgi:hypothetical protein
MHKPEPTVDPLSLGEFLLDIDRMLTACLLLAQRTTATPNAVTRAIQHAGETIKVAISVMRVEGA